MICDLTVAALGDMLGAFLVGHCNNKGYLGGRIFN
jgi:hypothetical protein